MSERPQISTAGELKASGHTYRPLRVEIRANLLARLDSGEDPWPGIHGMSRTVLPQLERALIAAELARPHSSLRSVAEALGLPRKTLHDKLRKHVLVFIDTGGTSPDDGE